MHLRAAGPIRLVLYLCLAAVAPLLPAQGPLTPPPGPPLPTMKTLDQVEARVIVNIANTPGDANNTFIISQPGSYYLTGNLNAAGGKNGISIQADGVTLDLNGFALIGEATGSGIGVDMPAPLTNLCVRNGTVRGWRSHGAGTLKASSSILERVRAYNNGGDGLQISNESVVRDCVMSGNLGRGLFGDDRVLVTGCVANVNTGSGIALGSDVVVVDCLVSRGFGTSPALFVRDRSTVSRCTVSRNAGTGIQIGQGSTAADCSVGSNDNGIEAGNGSTVRHCTLSSNGGVAIFIASSGCQVIDNICNSNGFVTITRAVVILGMGNRVEGNSCTNNAGGFGIAQNNLVIRNSAHNNGSSNFSFTGTGAGAATVIDVSAGGVMPEKALANFIF